MKEIFRVLTVWAITITFALFAYLGCAAFKKVARTANDIATMLCEMTAAEYTLQSRDGLSPKQWCEIKEHLDPFLDYILSTPQPDGLTK